MIIKLIFKCRLCGARFYLEAEPGEQPAGLILKQVATHHCEPGSLGIGDLQGCDTDDEVN